MYGTVAAIAVISFTYSTKRAYPISPCAVLLTNIKDSVFETIFSAANRVIFPVQLTTGRTGNLAHPVDPYSTARARSLRNLLVSGNECGRVFPAGVGPGSPSRDAANWLPSRFSLSVETRRRYGWLRMMVFPGARLFPSPNSVPFGRVAARERQGALSRRAW